MLGDGDAVRHRVVGQMVLAELQAQRAAPGDLHAVLDRFRQIGEQRGHFLGRLQVLLGRVVARPAFVVDHPALVDADARFVGVVVAAFEKAHVVAGNHRQADLACKADSGRQMILVVAAAAAGDLQIQAIREMRRPPAGDGAGMVETPGQQRLADFAVPTSERNQPVAGLGQPAALDSRPAARLAFAVRARHQPSQVAVAGRVLDQQGQAFRAIGITVFLQRHVGTDDRLDAGAFGQLVELHHREQVVLIGHGDGRQAELGGKAGQGLHVGARALARRRLDANQAVDQREFGVQVKVDEHRDQSTVNGGRHAAVRGFYRARLAASAQGAKLIRWITLAPCSRKAFKCSGVP